MLTKMQQYQYKEETKTKEILKNKIRPVIHNTFSIVHRTTQMIPGRSAHFGRRVSPKTRENVKFETRPISVEDDSLKLKGGLVKKRY